ncbi:MAG: hypothetical protein H6672_18625 [Anaerolineaceae bacterium]|nr:hypothetical protein [Anaerolineaceae bacterium]
MGDNDFRAVVVGQESLDNLRLSNTLRKFIGKEQIFRYLETRHLLEFLADKDRQAIGIFFDLFSFPVEEATQTIGYIRDRYPNAVFCIYLSNLEHQTLWHTLPEKWQQRIGHYIKLYKEPDDTELEPIVNLTLTGVWGLALSNLDPGSQKVSDWSEKFVRPYRTDDTAEDMILQAQLLSARLGCIRIVLTDRLRDKGFSIWIDQHLLVMAKVDGFNRRGRWISAKCSFWLYHARGSTIPVREMEYRYFFNPQTDCPLLYRAVGEDIMNYRSSSTYYRGKTLPNSCR